ncbi:MAG: hypothetical protein U0794_18880 [Isosphaeraceae bacterium]
MTIGAIASITSDLFTPSAPDDGATGTLSEAGLFDTASLIVPVSAEVLAASRGLAVSPAATV